MIILIFFLVEIIIDTANGIDVDNTTIIASIAVAAGSTPMYQRRNKMMKEMEGREKKTGE